MTLVIILVMLPSTLAHVAGGELKIVGDYRVQFRTIPDNPEKNERVILVFSIQDLEIRDIKNVTVRVEVKRDGETVYDTGEVREDFGDFDVSFTPAEDGEYKVILTFKHQDTEALTVDFSFKVGAVQRFPVEIIAGALILAAIVFLVRRRSASRG